MIMHEIQLGRLDLNLLRVLHLLLEERSVTRAAERLHLSPSATSHALARLRAHFDDPLLTRTADGMRPTTRAEAMAPALAQLMTDIRGLAGAETFDPAAAVAPVRMTASSTTMIEVLPKFARILAAEAPGLTLQCGNWTADTLDELYAGRIDLAIGARGQCAGEGLEIEQLMTDRYVTVVRRGHPVIETGLTRAAYETWPHLLIDPSDRSAGPVNQTLEALGVARPSAVTTHDALTAHLTVAQTDMILTVTETIAEYYARSADVVILELPLDVSDFALFLAWHPRRSRDPLHNWLRRTLRVCLPSARA